MLQLDLSLSSHTPPFKLSCGILLTYFLPVHLLDLLSGSTCIKGRRPPLPRNPPSLYKKMSDPKSFEFARPRVFFPSLNISPPFPPTGAHVFSFTNFLRRLFPWLPPTSISFFSSPSSDSSPVHHALLVPSTLGPLKGPTVRLPYTPICLNCLSVFLSLLHKTLQGNKP